MAKPQINLSHYDDPDRLSKYRRRYELGIYDSRIKAIEPFLRDIQNRVVLDLGCGPGYFSSLCLERQATVISVDWARTMVSYTVEKTGGVGVIADALSLPFTSAVFDYVLALDVIEHLFDPQALLTKAYKVLKTDGKLLIATDNRIHVFNTNPVLNVINKVSKRLTANYWRYYRLARLEAKSGGKGNPCTHVKIYTVDELIDLLEKNGFSVVDYDAFQYFDSIAHRLIRNSSNSQSWRKVRGDRIVLLAQRT